MSHETLAYVSNGLVYGAMTVLTLALLAFSLDFAYNGRRRAAAAAGSRRERARASVAVGGASGIGTGAPAGPATPVPGGASHPTLMDRTGNIAVSLTGLAFLLLVGAVATRGLSAGHWPWGNMYEFVLTASTVVLGSYLAVLTRWDVRYLGLFVTGAVLLFLGVDVAVLYTSSGQLVDALDSYWLGIHVTAAMVAAGVFTVGTVVTALFLVADRYERVLAAEGRPGAVTTWLAERLPSGETLDRNAYKLYVFAFPVWTFAVMAGAVWAQSAWGRYWGWDPKETWAFITWVFFAAYLHARATAGWRGRRAAVIALLGYASLLFNLVGVNIWMVGFHSYAR